MMFKHRLGTAFAAAVLTAACLGAHDGRAADEAIIDRFMKVTKNDEWRPVATIPVKFRTHHPQGMVKIGDTFFVSSVEIKVPTKRYPALQGGYDRDTGEGAGHLFQFDKDGNLIKDLVLGEGSAYHPGGIDFDGRWIWVPVAEYRPNSLAIIYRVDPQTMTAVEVFRFRDHIGGIVHNTDDGTLHGVSWGSRRLYRWTLNDKLEVVDAGLAPERLRTLNQSHYVDYQDCKYAGRRMMLCTGINAYRPLKDGPPFYLGGMDLIDLKTNLAVHQVPVQLWTEKGLTLTYNPVFVERSEAGLRAYFMPEDDSSRLFVHEVAIK